MKKRQDQGWAAVETAATALGTQDAAARDAADAARGVVDAAFPLARIRPRASDTRPLNAGHVAALAESIAVVGLLEPLVVDSSGQLLAGGHRLAALRLLSLPIEARPAAWADLTGVRRPNPEQQATMDRLQSLPVCSDRVPVRLMPFRAEADPAQALAVEVAENEKRRDYSRAEVRDLADRLRAAGYRATGGRPAAGERALGPALAVILGRSARQVRRLLDQETRTDVLVSDDRERRLALRALASAVRRWESHRHLYTDERWAGIAGAVQALAEQIGMDADAQRHAQH